MWHLFCKWNPELFIFKCIRLLGLLLMYITANVKDFVELEMGVKFCLSQLVKWSWKIRILKSFQIRK
jgi:hypothetical protein